MAKYLNCGGRAKSHKGGPPPYVAGEGYMDKIYLPKFNAGSVKKALRYTIILVTALFAVTMTALLSMFFYGFHINMKKEAINKLSTSERNLVIYDAFWNAVDKNYVDEAFDKNIWEKNRIEWRRKAATARNDGELYDNVLNKMAEFASVSHLNLVQPVRSVTTSASYSSKSFSASGFAETVANANPGFSVAVVRRGNKQIPIVDEVVAGGPAEKSAVEPGEVVYFMATTTCKNGSGQFGGIFGDPLNETDPEKKAQNTNPQRRILTIGPEHQRSISFTFACAQAAATEPAGWNFKKGATYIRVDSFASRIGQDREIEAVLAAIDRASPRGVVLDLRHNAGGFEFEALRVLGKFLPSDAVVGFRRGRGGLTALHPWPSLHRFSGPVVVLVGPSTASAAELFAGALQFHRRALIVGRRTNGAVMIARFYNLPDGGRVQVPVAIFLDPRGVAIEGRGVMPDFVLPPEMAHVGLGRDPAFEAATSYLK